MAEKVTGVCNYCAVRLTFPSKEEALVAIAQHVGGAPGT